MPCVGLWTSEGSVVSMFSPWLTSKNNENVLKLGQLPLAGSRQIQSNMVKWPFFPAVYQDFIYFFYSDSSKNTIKLNIVSSKHSVVSKSNLAQRHDGRIKGLSVGSHFFIHGSNLGNSELNPDKGYTALWSFVKESWIEGPTLVDFLFPITEDPYFFKDEFCSLTINKTTALFIKRVHVQQGIYAFNFQTKNWTVVTYLPDTVDLILKSCQLFISKNGSRIVTMLANNYYTCQKMHSIQTYNLDLKLWTSFLQSKSSNCIQGNHILNLSGSIFNVEIIQDLPRNSSAVKFSKLEFDFSNEMVTCEHSFWTNITFSQGDDFSTPANCEAENAPHYKVFQFYHRYFESSEK